MQMMPRRYDDRARNAARMIGQMYGTPADEAAMLEDCTRIPALERTIMLGRLLARETSEEGVWDALATHAPGICRAWAGGCMVADAEGRLRPPDASPTDAEEDTPSIAPAVEAGLTMAEFGGPSALSMYSRVDALEHGPARSLRFLFRDERVRRAALATVGERGLVIVVERRERELQPDDWYRLRVIADQASSALNRIRAASGSASG